MVSDGINQMENPQKIGFALWCAGLILGFTGFEILTFSLSNANLLCCAGILTEQWNFKYLARVYSVILGYSAEMSK